MLHKQYDYLEKGRKERRLSLTITIVENVSPMPESLLHVGSGRNVKDSATSRQYGFACPELEPYVAVRKGKDVIPCLVVIKYELKVNMHNIRRAWRSLGAKPCATTAVLGQQKYISTKSVASFAFATSARRSKAPLYSQTFGYGSQSKQTVRRSRRSVASCDTCANRHRVSFLDINLNVMTLASTP